jgi:hypothetical protein
MGHRVQRVRPCVEVSDECRWVPSRDPRVRAELVRESERTRVRRLFLPGRTVIAKEPRGPDANRRLRHELAILERLRGVAGVAQLLGEPRYPGSIAVADVGGAALAELAKPLPVDELIGLALELARAVAEVHSRGLMHRDISPANVVLSLDGSPRLVDFALATPLAEIRPEFTHHGEMVGTWHVHTRSRRRRYAARLRRLDHRHRCQRHTGRRLTGPCRHPSSALDPTPGGGRRSHVADRRGLADAYGLLAPSPMSRSGRRSSARAISSPKGWSSSILGSSGPTLVLPWSIPCSVQCLAVPWCGSGPAGPWWSFAISARSPDSHGRLTDVHSNSPQGRSAAPAG